MVDKSEPYDANAEGDWECGKWKWRFSYKDGKWSAFCFTDSKAYTVKASWDDKANCLKFFFPHANQSNHFISYDKYLASNGMTFTRM
jgi:hypothetical protein